MDRLRDLEVISANAALQVVSSRFAPETKDRIVLFLADRGPVSHFIGEYHESGDLEQTCLNYWNGTLEPDALRLEDLVSALLISFATSFAASIVIEAGRAAFPAIYRRLKASNLEMVLKDLSRAEGKRRDHLMTLLDLLNKKAEAVRSAEIDYSKDLALVRKQLAEGSSLRDATDQIPIRVRELNLTFLESAVRGTLLTEQQLESGFETEGTSAASETLTGLPINHYFGVGQILHGKIDEIIRQERFGTAYKNAEEFIADIGMPLREPHKNHSLKRSLRRPPKKVIPVQDKDLSSLLESPLFYELKPQIGALILRFGGMTSHTGVLSRSLGIPCIQLDEQGFLKLKSFGFAAVQEGKALLFHSLPNYFYQYL